MLSEVLKRKDIYTFFSRSAFEKGYVYQAQGRVTGLEVSDDLTRIRAKVRGSSSKDYRVKVKLVFDGDRLADLDGECGCPMMINCKHVVATLLEAMGEQRPPGEPTSPRDKVAEAPSTVILSHEVSAWLDSLGETAAHGATIISAVFRHSSLQHYLESLQALAELHPPGAGGAT